MYPGLFLPLEFWGLDQGEHLKQCFVQCKPVIGPLLQ